MTATRATRRISVPRALLGAAILGLSVPAFYALGAMTLVFLIVGGAALGSSLPTEGSLTRMAAMLLGIGLAIGLFSLFAQVVQ